MPGTPLSLVLSFHLTLAAVLWVGTIIIPILQMRKVGAQRGVVTCHSSQLVSVELGFQPTQLDPESIVFHGTQQNIFLSVFVRMVHIHLF